MNRLLLLSLGSSGRLNPQIKNFTFGDQTVIRWKSFDGWVIEGALVKPVNFEQGKKYPMLVAVHGGPYGRVQNILRQYYNLQVWANEGYLVFAPNFRGYLYLIFSNQTLMLL